MRVWFSLFYVALVQLQFSELDLFARISLKNGASFLAAIDRPWVWAWFLGQLFMTPLQVRLITGEGIGRGVALMNAFSLLFACAFSVLVAHETLRPCDWAATALVVCAVGLLAVAKAAREQMVPAEGSE